MSDAISLFRRATREGEEARNLQRIASEPMQKRALDQFRKAVDRAPDAKAALCDPRLLGVLAQALSIPQAASQPGLAARVLLSDPEDPRSAANALGDPRWKAAARTLKLHAGGVAALMAARGITRLT
ncbi:hypothetical protein [Sabulicella glaciei]|uniref:DUF1217 domain-containing protein n=1 Tax=Sabulicella glaciei TaxID=2984948 RepID=A0ABT3NUY2_9PROT|nr:hypothetical protein [Roseococcus sp. MDT2-1-1]MCW8085963.1 DUF1217 domain-containing protein [Roseococcus sp. MDT2-1-1]